MQLNADVCQFGKRVHDSKEATVLKEIELLILLPDARCSDFDCTTASKLSIWSLSLAFVDV